jgi:xylulose-5-phosphate/fructose-6-phosphate phosphoketolase
MSNADCLVTGNDAGADVFMSQNVIRSGDWNVIGVCGPGHGGPGMVANIYLKEPTELYPNLRRMPKGYGSVHPLVSWRYSSHASAETLGR